MKISLVIPAFNEERRLPETLEKIAAYVKGRPETWEVIVVDDGSRDETLTRARDCAASLGLSLELIRLPENRGKGAALRAGVAKTRGERVLICDADLSTPIGQWEKLAAAGASVAIGSRALDESLIGKKQPWHRRTMGKAFNLLVRALSVPGIRDTQCGFKLFDGDLARELFGRSRIDRFAYDVEILSLARRRGVTIAEVPVAWFNSPESRVAVIRDSLRMFRDLIRIRFRR